MESKIKVTFWLNKTKKNASKLVPVYLRVKYNYDFFTKSTGVLIKEADWDKKAMRVKGNTHDANIANNKLEGIKIKIHQIISQLTVLGKPFNIHTIKDTLDGRSIGQVTVLKAIDEHLKLMKRLKGKDYEQPTIIKYTNTRLRIQQFVKYKFKRSDLYLYELNDQFMTDWEIFLKEKFDNSKTTCYKHYQRFTLVIRKAVQKGYLDKYPFPEYKIRMPRKRIEYLDREELSRIENLEIKVNRLEIVRDVFVFCCHTGLAYAEVSALRPEHIFIGMDNEQWLRIMRKKTKKEYCFLAGTVGLFCMLWFIQYLPYIFFSAGSYCFSTLDKSLRTPITKELMCRSQVILNCCIAVWSEVSFMRCDLLILMIDLNHCLIVKHLHLLTNVFKWHTVIMLVDTQAYMIIFHHRNRLLMPDIKTMEGHVTSRLPQKPFCDYKAGLSSSDYSTPPTLSI
ncbi:MAG: site-specific integrase [Deltaproteobacteria bacterium]|nr:site-specific integrase [Deltaproteobacteria bacterium]